MTNHPFCYHTAVTLLSHHPFSTTTPPHRAKFAVTILSHYCHTTITGAISSQKINFFPQRIDSFTRKVPHFPEKVPHFPEDVRYFLEKIRYFLEKVGHNWRECSPWLRSPVTDVTEKKHKTPGNTRARARVEIKAMTSRALVTCSHGERCCYGRTVESPHDYVLVASRVN